MRWSLCAAMLCVSVWGVDAAQAPVKSAGKKEPPAGVIRVVNVTGNKRYAAAEIVKEAGLKVGDPVTGAAIERARLKLQSTELFTNVSERFKWTATTPPGYDVTFEITENEQVFPLRFERLGQSGEQLRPCLQASVPLYSDEIPASEGVLQRYRQAVQACLAQSGPAPKVKTQVSNEDPKELAVLFSPDKPPPTVSQVEVSGNESVDTGTLLRAINQVAIGVPLTDVRLKQVLDGSIKQIYASKGFVGVTFPKVEAVPSKTNDGVVLKIQIKEGPVFNFGAIRFHGTGMDADEVKANIPFHPGQGYNARQVDDFRIWLAHSFRQKGHLDASVTFETSTDDPRRLVNVTYTVTPGPIYSFASLDVRGLDLVSAPVIQEMWGEKPGKPFNPDYPDFFLKRVEDRHLFDNLGQTSSDYTADPATHSVIVHLYFKGGKSREQIEKDEKEAKEKRQSDGTWSPWFRAAE